MFLSTVVSFQSAWETLRRYSTTVNFREAQAWAAGPACGHPADANIVTNSEWRDHPSAVRSTQGIVQFHPRGFFVR